MLEGYIRQPMFRRRGHRFADESMRHSTSLERVPIPKERSTLCRADLLLCGKGENRE
jgi:hypothetical protein